MYLNLVIKLILIMKTTAIRNMKLNTLIEVFRELENGKSFVDIKEKMKMHPSFIYIYSKVLKRDDIIRLVQNPKNKKNKNIKLTAKGKKLKSLFEIINDVV